MHSSDSENKNVGRAYQYQVVKIFGDVQPFTHNTSVTERVSCRLTDSQIAKTGVITLTRVKTDSSSCGSEPSKIQRYCTHLALYRTDESDSCRKLAGARVGRRSTVGRAGSIWRRRAESNRRSQTRDTQRREPGRRSSSQSDCVPVLPAHRRQRHARSASRALSLSSESYLAHNLED